MRRRISESAGGSDGDVLRGTGDMIPAGQLNHRKSVKHPKHVPSPKISLSHNMLLCFSKWVITSLQRGNLPVCRLKLAASCLQDLR